jgi:hypothetical protein
MVTGQLKACDDELSSEDCVGSDPSVAVCRWMARIFSTDQKEEKWRKEMFMLEEERTF